MNKYSVNYKSKSFDKDVVKILKKEGVVIIENVFDDDEMDTAMDDFYTSLKKVCPSIKQNKPKTWKSANLLPQTRSGLFQSIVGNFPVVWEYRSRKEIRNIFETVYSGLRNKKVDEFVVGVDGANFRPPIKPFHTDKTKDWAHLDMTMRNKTYYCVQGQIVMSNTTASFRASPRSHHDYETILDKGNVSKTESSNWFKMPQSMYSDVEKLVKKQKGEFQIPILAKKGSVILWLSSLVHSARIQTDPQKKSFEQMTSSRTHRDPTLTKRKPTKSKWDNWRGVIYVCYRPKEDVNETHLKRLQRCFKENRLTNHWGARMFPKKPRYFTTSSHEETITKYVEDPTLVYKIKGMKPKLTKEIKSLIGL